MNNIPTTAAQAAQYSAFSDMSEADRVQLFQDAYMHGKYAMLAYGEGYTKNEPPSVEVLDHLGFPSEVAEAFAKTHSRADQFKKKSSAFGVAVA